MALYEHRFISHIKKEARDFYQKVHETYGQKMPAALGLSHLSEVAPTIYSWVAEKMSPKTSEEHRAKILEAMADWFLFEEVVVDFTQPDFHVTRRNAIDRFRIFLESHGVYVSEPSPGLEYSQGAFLGTRVELGAILDRKLEDVLGVKKGFPGKGKNPSYMGVYIRNKVKPGRQNVVQLDLIRDAL